MATNMSPDGSARWIFLRHSSIRGDSNSAKSQPFSSPLQIIICTLSEQLVQEIPSRHKALDMLGEIFDPAADFSIRETCKPHWSQAGAVVFITFRLRDSIPVEVIQRWDRQRVDWLQRRGIRNVSEFNWKTVKNELAERELLAFENQFRREHERYLDNCQGACILREPRAAKIVGDALRFFDGQHYALSDYVVMPNHVHLLVSFADEDRMRRQCTSWLHFTARSLNRLFGCSGRVWQSDPFDHLVRSPQAYDYYRQYIAENPRKACLRPEESLIWRNDQA